jgi:DNA-binding transcriptional LysR family regulator
MDLIDRVAHRLKLRDLRLLDAVVRTKSMARAAAQLNLTQPAVSKAIAELEHTVGVRLLDRGRSGIEPTPHGRALLKSGIAIFDDLRQGVREIEFLSDPTGGEVRVGAPEFIIGGILPVIFDRISRRHPRIVFQVTQVLTGTQQARDLRERNFDLFLGRLVQTRKEHDLITEVLFDEPMFVVVGAQNPLLRRRKINFAELIDELWVLPRPETVLGSYIGELFQAGGRPSAPAGIFCNSIKMQWDMVASGRFIGLFPRSVLHFASQRTFIKVLPVAMPPELGSRLAPVGIVTLKNRTISPVAQLFIQYTRELGKLLGKAEQRS